MEEKTERNVRRADDSYKDILIDQRNFDLIFAEILNNPDPEMRDILAASLYDQIDREKQMAQKLRDTERQQANLRAELAKQQAKELEDSKRLEEVKKEAKRQMKERLQQEAEAFKMECRERADSVRDIKQWASRQQAFSKDNDQDLYRDFLTQLDNYIMGESLIDEDFIGVFRKKGIKESLLRQLDGKTIHVDDDDEGEGEYEYDEEY